jgi:ubiquinone biosynthesis protein Coq4
MNLSPLRTMKTLYALGVLVRDPNQLSKVFEMADALATPELLGPMVDVLAKDPEGARAFAEKPRLRIDLAELRVLPEGTLGREFADHMLANGLDPAAMPHLETPDDHSFLRAHLYETHDVWHVVTGFATDWPAEIGLQAFYLAQIPGPLSAALVGVGCLRLAAYDMRSRDGVMDAVVYGWTMGKRARALFGVRWNDLWSVPLSEVRARLGVVVDEPDSITRAAA